MALRSDIRIVCGPNFTQHTLTDVAPFQATYYFTGTPAATNQVFFVAPANCTVVAISQVHSTAAGGASTLTVEKDTGTTAPGSGTAVQTGSFNLNATANTVQTATLKTDGTATLAAGDRLAVNFANTIQSTAGLVVTVWLVAA
jgi:hypothetical protein